MAEITTGLSEHALDVAAAVARVSVPANGGIAVFIGTVRESAAVAQNRDRRVVELDYEAHPDLAPQRMTEIAQEAAAKWEVSQVVAIHRTGRCALGEPTVVVACGAPHRDAALDACHWIIDTVKSTVPIWKREIYEDGSSWVGAEGTGG